MAPVNCATVKVEELQRRLDEANARNSQLEHRFSQLEKYLGVNQSAPPSPSALNVAESPVQADLSHGLPLAAPTSVALSRSKSNIVFPQSSTSGESPMQAHKRQRRAFSQQYMSPPTAHDMSRSVSNHSLPESHLPFFPRAPFAPMANPALTRYCSSQDEPANQSLQGGQLQRVPNVQETNGNTAALLSIGMAPQEWLASLEEPNSMYMQIYHLSPSQTYAGPMSPTCPSMISGSSAEGASPMTRQNSSWGEAQAMVRMPSTQSQYDYLNSEPSPPNTNGKRPAPEQILIGLGANLPPAAPHEYAPLNAANSSFLSSPPMERSISSTSASSVRTTASQLERRAKEARERVLQNSKAFIAPKPAPPSETASTPVAPVMQAKRDVKIPANKENKNNYVRPKHPKVFCTQCSEHPEGFRGDHELRRHISAKHEVTVKRFVCVDPASRGLESEVKAINPLNKCKACTSGKQYNAYYNAAAHLRRTHFKPKTIRGKSKQTVDEKRGGKGGGDWPPMNELKLWFQEVIVNVDQTEGSMAEASDDEDVEEELFDAMDMPLASNSLFSTAFNISVDCAESSFLSTPADIVLPAGLSPVDSVPDYSPYPNGSPISAIGDFPSFTDQDLSVFDSDVAATMAVTGFGGQFM